MTRLSLQAPEGQVSYVEREADLLASQQDDGILFYCNDTDRLYLSASGGFANVPTGAGGSSLSFLDLTDTPEQYPLEANRFLRTTESGLEFVAPQFAYYEEAPQQFFFPIYASGQSPSGNQGEIENSLLEYEPANGRLNASLFTRFQFPATPINEQTFSSLGDVWRDTQGDGRALRFFDSKDHPRFVLEYSAPTVPTTAAGNIDLYVSGLTTREGEDAATFPARQYVRSQQEPNQNYHTVHFGFNVTNATNPTGNIDDLLKPEHSVGVWSWNGLDVTAEANYRPAILVHKDDTSVAIGALSSTSADTAESAFTLFSSGEPATTTSQIAEGAGYNVVGLTLDWEIDGVAQATITFTGVNPLTAQQVVDQINAAGTLTIAALAPSGPYVTCHSNTPGLTSSIVLLTGVGQSTAKTAFDFPAATAGTGTEAKRPGQGGDFAANIFLKGNVAVSGTIDPDSLLLTKRRFSAPNIPITSAALWADFGGNLTVESSTKRYTVIGRRPEDLDIRENSLTYWVDTVADSIGDAVKGSDWVMGGATGTTLNYVGATGGPVIDGGINAKGFFKDGVEIGAGGAGIPTVGSSTDNALVRWDGVSGDAVQDTPWIRVFDVGTFSINSPVTATNAMSIVAETLTNGKALSVTSGSEDATTRQLVYIHNESEVATGTVPLYVANESPTETVFIANNINGPALRAETFATTGFGYELNADALTTGTGLYLRSNSANTSSRAVAHFLNDNALATGAQVLRLQQDANQVSLRLEGTGGGSISMNEVATVPGGAPGAGNGTWWVRNDGGGSVPVFTDDNAVDHVLNAAGGGGIPTIGSSTDHALVRWDGVSGDAVQNTSFATLSDLGELSLTSSATTSAALQITANSLANNGSGITVDSNSADATYRYLVNINQVNASATQAGALSIFQNGPQSAVSLYSAGNGKVITADGAATTSDIAEIKSSTITTGTVLHISSNSANTSTRSVSQFINDNTAATGANCIRTQQDAAQVSMLMEGTGGGSIKMLEVASVPGGSPGAGYGTWWVRNDSKPIFTDDGGVDHDLSASGSGIPTIGSSVDNALVRWDGVSGGAVQNTSFATLSDLGEMTLASTATTGTVLDIDANSLTTGNGIDIRSTSGDTGSRELLFVRNGSLAATGTKCLYVTQEAANYAVEIESLGNGAALRTTCFSSTAHAHELNADSITTGSGLRVRSNSFNTSSRAVCHFINDHTSATGAQVLRLQQDANQVSLRLEGTGGGSISMNEVATVPGGAPGAGNGTWWVRNDGGGSVPVFTDDNSVDHVLNAAGGATTFLGLTDTPSSYATQALKAVRVNAGATALEFFDAATGDVTTNGAVAANKIATYFNSTGDVIKGDSDWRIASNSLTFNQPTSENICRIKVRVGGNNRTAPTGVVAQFINRAAGDTGGDPCHLQLVAGTVGSSRLMFGDNNADFAGGLEYNHLGDTLTFRQKNVDVGYVSFNGGLVWGNPTGISDVAGHINAERVFDDGVQLTDYVFEAFFEGEPRDEQHKDYRMNTLDEEIEHIETELHLSTMPSRKEWEENGDGTRSLGGLVTRLWESVECQMLYIRELEERISALEEAQA